MPAIIYPKELKRFEAMPYADVCSEHLVATHTGSLLAGIAAEVLKKKEDPRYFTIFGLLRDLLRKPRYRLFAPRDGHWACIVGKFKAQKSDKDFIRNWIALGAFLAVVIFSLYRILK